MNDALTIVGDDTFEFLQIQRAPAQVLAEAREAAVAIKDVLANKTKPVMMNGEQYLEFEDWQTVGRFYGMTAEIEWTRYCEFGGARGFEARAVAKHALSGRIVSAGESMCLNDEPRWNTRPKYEWIEDKDANGQPIWKETKDGKRYKAGTKKHVGDDPVPLAQLRSMAQTRAAAKALRNVLAWVVVLAGYRATPAEELQTENDGNGGHRVDTATTNDGKPPIQAPQRKSQSPAAGGGTIVRTRVKDIAKKEGTNDKGPWTKFILSTLDGKSYGTFSTTHRDVAHEAMQSEAEVEIAYTESKYGRDLQSITLAMADRHPGDEG